MKNLKPTISHFMAANPIFVETDASVDRARELMHEHKVRHLPVLEKGKLVGMLTDRDMKLAFSLFRTKITSTKTSEVLVGDICVRNPVEAHPNDLLSDVAYEMARARIGSVVITDRGKLVGIFTTVDACMALHTLLKSGGKVELLESQMSRR